MHDTGPGDVDMFDDVTSAPSPRTHSPVNVDDEEPEDDELDEDEPTGTSAPIPEREFSRIIIKCSSPDLESSNH